MIGRERNGHIAMMGFSALVAGSFALGSSIAGLVSPLVVTTLRFVFTAILFGCIASRSLRTTRAWRDAPWRYLLLGACPALYFIFMFEALKTAPAISLSVEFTLTPLITGIFGYILLGQIANRQTLLALLLGAFGAIWVIFRGDIAQLLAFKIHRGEMIFFIGMSCYALYAPLVRKLNRGEPPNVFTFAVTIGALIVTLPFAAQDLIKTDYAALGLWVWIVILYLAFFASALTFSLIQFASLRLPSVKVMAHTYLIPSWVILWQLMLGQNAPSTTEAVGVALTIAALSILIRAKDTIPGPAPKANDT